METRQGERGVYCRTQSDLRDDDPDYPALVLGNYMLGGLQFPLSIGNPTEKASVTAWVPNNGSPLDKDGTQILRDLCPQISAGSKPPSRRDVQALKMDSQMTNSACQNRLHASSSSESRAR
jgi:hypothetical protein